MNSNYETLYGVHLLDDLHNYFPALLYDSSGFGSMRDVLAYVQQQTRTRFDLFSYGLREYQSRHPPRWSGVTNEPPRWSGVTNEPPPPSPSAPENASYRRVVRTSFAGMPAPMSTPLSTLLRQPANTSLSQTSAGASEAQSISQNELYQSTLQSNIPRIQVELNTYTNEADDGDDEDDEQPLNDTRLITNALMSLLQIPTTGLTRTYDINTFGTILGRGRDMDQFLQPVVVHPTPEQIAANTTVGNLVSDTDHACAICQDALTSEQQGRKLNACGHWFHQSCIDTWLERDVHCPVCRHDIREPLRQNSPELQN